MDTTIEYKDSLKVLHKIITEPNEFKRYNLLQMWVSQLFTNTIIDPVRMHENRLSNTTNLTADLEVQSLYDVLRNIKTSLAIKNEELTKVLGKMQQNANVLKVLNKTLELDQDTVVDEYTKQLDKLKQLIATNTKYIQSIQNLSESKIEESIKDESENN